MVASQGTWSHPDDRSAATGPCVQARHMRRALLPARSPAHMSREWGPADGRSRKPGRARHRDVGVPAMSGYMVMITERYFSITSARRIFSVGVTRPDA